MRLEKKILGIGLFDYVCYSTVVSVGLLLVGCGCTIETHEDTSRPQWCKKVTPEYPIAARRANAEGKVVLEATIDVDGKAKDIEVTEDGVGFGCTQAAMRALKGLSIHSC